MSKTLDFVVVSNDDNSYIVDDQYLQAVDLTKEELLAVFGDRAKEHKVIFKPQNYGMKREINRAAQVPDLITGFRLDPDLIPAARASVVVDHWSFSTPVSVEGFNKLDYLIGEYISAAIQKYLFPDVGGDVDFFEAVIAKRRSSEVKVQE